MKSKNYVTDTCSDPQLVRSRFASTSSLFIKVCKY